MHYVVLDTRKLQSRSRSQMISLDLHLKVAALSDAHQDYCVDILVLICAIPILCIRQFDVSSAAQGQSKAANMSAQNLVATYAIQNAKSQSLTFLSHAATSQSD